MADVMQAQNISMARQNGVVLVTVLVFLVLLTLVSLTGMRGAAMEERMAGNVRDRDLAFQAAEIALRTAESYLRSTALAEAEFNDDPTATTAGTNPGLVPLVMPTSTRTSDEPGRIAYWRGYNWAVHSRQTGSDVPNTAERPRYVIELLGATNMVSQRGGQAKPEPNTYRITARGVGLSGTAVAFLQSTYLKQ